MHPDSKEIANKGNGPAKVVYEDGEEHFTENLAWTTAIKYVNLDLDPITTKASSVKRVVWLDMHELDAHR